MDLIRDVLDKQLVDRNHRPLGKVDGIVITITPNEQPVVAQITSGLPVAADRLSKRLGRLVRRLGQRFGMRRGRTLIIPWHHVQDVGITVTVNLDVDTTEALNWEVYLKEKIVRKIPGSGQ